MQTDRDSLIALAASGTWPLAAPSHQIVPDNDWAKGNRADIILEKMVRVTPGKKFLDFGCGEGYGVSQATQAGCTAIGYDPVYQGWERHSRGHYTTDWQEALDHAPYDIILVYDVLDHVANKQQISVLQQLQSVLAPGGTVFVRNHPYVALHGTHLYNTLNLAWVHLLLSDEDIQRLGGVGQRVCRVVRPLDTYRGWFQGSGWRTQKEEAVRCPIPPMFHDPDILALLAQNTYKAGLQGGARIQNKDVLHSFLSVQFVDYELVI